VRWLLLNTEAFRDDNPASLVRGRLTWEAEMAVLTKAEALAIIRRAYGPDLAESIEDRLPEQIDPDDDADAEFLATLGLTRDGLANALGGEL
jgi:hypothetical protein